MARPRQTPVIPVLRALLRLSRVSTLRELAEAQDLPSGTVRSWDQRGIVPADALQRIAEALGTTTDEVQRIAAQMDDAANGLTRDESGPPAGPDAAYAPALASEPAPALYAGQQALAWSGHARMTTLTPSVDYVALPTPAGTGVGSPNPVPQERGCALIPVADARQVAPLAVRLSDGEGGAAVQYHVIPRHLPPGADGAPQPVDLAGHMAVDATWATQHLRGVVGPVVSRTVVGDSMDRTLRHGDIVLVDEGIAAVTSDGVYVIELQGSPTARRIQRLHDGGLTLIPDNPSYRRETLRPAAAARLRVLGRVVWPHGR